MPGFQVLRESEIDVATMATLGVRSRSPKRSPVAEIPLNHAVERARVIPLERRLLVDKLGSLVRPFLFWRLNESPAKR